MGSREVFEHSFLSSESPTGLSILLLTSCHNPFSLSLRISRWLCLWDSFFNRLSPLHHLWKVGCGKAINPSFLFVLATHALLSSVFFFQARKRTLIIICLPAIAVLLAIGFSLLFTSKVLLPPVMFVLVPPPFFPFFFLFFFPLSHPHNYTLLLPVPSSTTARGASTLTALTLSTTSVPRTRRIFSKGEGEEGGWVGEGGSFVRDGYVVAVVAVVLV